MTKPVPTNTTVLLLRPDASLKEDPYLAFLATVPELGDVSSDSSLRLIVAAFRELANAPLRAEMTPGRVDRVRSFLLRVDSGDHSMAILSMLARDLASDLFQGTPGWSSPGEDLTTPHYGVIPDTYGKILEPTPWEIYEATFVSSWTRWHAERARLEVAGAVLDPDLDALMGQLEAEGIDAEEAEAAVVDLFIRDRSEVPYTERSSLTKPRK